MESITEGDNDRAVDRNRGMDDTGDGVGPGVGKEDGNVLGIVRLQSRPYSKGVEADFRISNQMHHRTSDRDAGSSTFTAEPPHPTLRRSIRRIPRTPKTFPTREFCRSPHAAFKIIPHAH